LRSGQLFDAGGPGDELGVEDARRGRMGGHVEMGAVEAADGPREESGQ
jgi:hypothetical protein